MGACAGCRDLSQRGAKVKRLDFVLSLSACFESSHPELCRYPGALSGNPSDDEGAADEEPVRTHTHMRLRSGRSGVTDVATSSKAGARTGGGGRAGVTIATPPGARGGGQEEGPAGGRRAGATRKATPGSKIGTGVGGGLEQGSCWAYKTTRPRAADLLAGCRSCNMAADLLFERALWQRANPAHSVLPLMPVLRPCGTSLHPQLVLFTK